MTGKERCFAVEQNDFGKMLRRLREEAGYKSQTRFAAACGVDNSTIARLERGETKPTPETLKKLAPCLGVPYEELLAAAGYLGRAGERRFSPCRRIPVLGRIRAGVPIMAVENFDRELDIPADWRADFALQVEGDSMIGVGIHEGDYAVCRQVSAPKPGDIVVAVHDIAAGFSEATLKYYFNDPQKGPVLRAANPEYEDIILKNDYRIVGVMVALLKSSPPPYQRYTEYLSTRDYALKEWDQVIQIASQCGVRPEQVLEIIKMQWQMAQRLFERQEKYRSE
jgi:repressor LexA